jgi:hypothetical protein
MFQITKNRSFFRSIPLIVALWALPAACASAVESHDRQIIWMDAKEHSSAMFIPERLLNERALEDLPLTDAERSWLQSRLDRATRGNPEREKDYKRLGRPYLACPPASLDDRSSKALSLLGYLKTTDLAFIATVEDVVPGWSFWIGQPVNMVYVKPVLFLHEKHQTDDRVLIYAERWASITVNGAQVCSWTPPEGFYRARKGDKVLVGAFLYPSNPRIVDGVSVFPTSEGKVLPQPYSMVQDFVPITVDDLRLGLRTTNEKE